MPYGLRSLLEKHVFDPFFTHFLIHNGPFSRHFGLFHGAKRVISGSKWAKNTCLSIPHGPGSLVEKRIFDPFLTQFWSQIGPFSGHFGSFHGPKRVTTGSKWAKNTSLSIPNGLGSFLENAFLTHFGPIFGLETAHYQGILGFSVALNAPPRAQNGLKTCV